MNKLSTRAYLIGIFLCFLRGPTRPFCLFSFFSHDTFVLNLTINDKSIDGVLGIRTQGDMMVGVAMAAPLIFLSYICKL